MRTFTRSLVYPLILFLSLLGCSQKPVTVGFIGSLTGPVSTHGIVSREAVVLAVEEQNARGGIHGRTIDLIIQDDKNTPEIAVAKLRELIDLGAVAVIGPQTSAMSRALLPILKDQPIPIISPSTSSDYFSGMDDYFYTLVSSVSFETRHLAWYLSSQEEAPIRIAMVYDVSNNTYTENWVNTLSSGIQDFDGEITRTQSFHSGENPAFSIIAQNILQDDPNTIGIAAGALQAAILSQQLRLEGFGGRLVISGWAKTPDFIGFGGDAVQGSLFSERYNSEDDSPRFRSFVESFKDRFAHEPDFQSAHSYEAAQFLITAMEKLPPNRLDGNHPEELKAALDSISEFQGLQGMISIDKGDSKRSLYLQEARGKDYIPIGKPWNPPDTVATPPNR